MEMTAPTMTRPGIPDKTLAPGLRCAGPTYGVLIEAGAINHGRCSHFPSDRSTLYGIQKRGFLAILWIISDERHETLLLWPTRK
jgi:hypothetical protein